MRKLLSLIVGAALLVTLVVGCAFAEGEVKTIRLGSRADMVNQVESAREAVRAGGYELEVTFFNDSVLPNVALGEKSIDINWYQHEPYMRAYNANNNTDFVMVTPKTFFPLFGMFSEKWTDVSQLPDGATIGLCNDVTNLSRALFMLQDEGLIKLADGVEVPTIFDIAENPRKFKFIEAEMSLLPQSIKDCDGICLAASHMVNAGMRGDNPICSSRDNDTYAVGFVVRGEDADAQWAKDLAKLVQCDKLAEYFAIEKGGTQVPTWK